MKPKHQGGYTALHTELCERTLVTLLRGLGPWKECVYLIGGLVPRYLIPIGADSGRTVPAHAGTTDVDLLLDLEMLSNVDAYQRLEQNLRALGFVRGTNDDGHVQHFSWRKSVGQGISIVVDLLCDAEHAAGGEAVDVPGERRLSALSIPGAHLAARDYLEVELTAELLDARGVATEHVRVANIVPFLVLKALAYDDRFEQKDAYDIVYCLMHHPGGPQQAAAQFKSRLQEWSSEPLLGQTIEILRSRFATDEHLTGARKDGPTSYASFLADPGRRDRDARHRQDAAAIVELFLAGLEPM